MAESSDVMEAHGYEEVPEEVVETSYMCGECFLLFPTTEDFNAHECQLTAVEGMEGVCHEGVSQDPQPHDLPQTNPCVNTVVWETQETEAAMEEAVASILGERMKKMAPMRNSSPEGEFEQTLVVTGETNQHTIEHTSLIEPQLEPVVEHTVDHTDHMDQTEGGIVVESVEIPSANVYMYDNPVYLNRLMKDNTFGRRVRHDAPYSHRLGPWDNKSSRLLIQLLKENPKAYFILDKECKRTEAWEMIRVKLVEAGYQFTVLQIRMRWRELCKKYRNTVNNNDMHNTRKACQYFDELNELFGIWDRPATLLLIRQLEANGSKRLGQNGGTRMRLKVWEHIRQVLAAHGYNYNADQVQGRWSTLVTLYQRMVEHNSKPHNEPINIAFKDHIERVFKYVPERNSKWLKIMEKRGKTPKALKKRWTLPFERILLQYYRDRVYRFNNEHVSNTALWQEIVQQLSEEAAYSTTVEKVRTRFYELTKQFSAMEQHNAQPGTIRRECRHHEMLSEIYGIYSYWPHDRSTIKLEKSGVIRMRQVNAQLMWSEEESRALLQLYPQVLVAHLSSGDHQPIEELWLQLAKAYLTTQNDRKQCYEIEEHIALLRRGYRSQNPFPFESVMQMLEETEMTLGFTPEPVTTDTDQLVPYWSHTAAHLLLDLVMHHRQEAVKNTNLFEMISHDMARHGFRYTGEECRMYYSLLRQLYTNRMRTIKRNKELLKPFPYMEKMAELDTVVSQPRFTETEKNKEIIVSTACSKLEPIEDGDEESQRDFLVNMLTNLKMTLKRNKLVHPPPPVKQLARILIEAMTGQEDYDADIPRLQGIFQPHMALLESIAEKGTLLYYQPLQMRKKGDKLVVKKFIQQKYGTVQWTEENIRALLEAVKEWRLLCHDEGEFESALVSGQPLWKELAAKLTARHKYKVCPNKCQERFAQMCREYKSVVLFNARLGPGEVPKAVTCEEVLENILRVFVGHDAELDVRDEWWVNKGGGDWGREETLELLFTVREFWPGWPKIPMDWEIVSQLMKAGGYQREAESCQAQFQQLYSSYQAAAQHNQTCGIRFRRRSPFYFKLKTLFGYKENTETLSFVARTSSSKVDIDAEEVMTVLVSGLRELKGHSCHSVPRWPLLVSLAQYLDQYYQNDTPTFTPFQVWHSLVQLHHTHREDLLQGSEVVPWADLDGLWEDHPNPLVAFALHAVPIPGWQGVSDWSVDEINLLVESLVSWELQPRNMHAAGKTMMKTTSELLHSQGYTRSPSQCQDQWQYMVATFRHGGYHQFASKMNLIKLLGSHTIPYPQPVDVFVARNSDEGADKGNTVEKGKPKIRVIAGQKKDHPKCSVRKMKINGEETAVLLLADQECKVEKGTNTKDNQQVGKDVSGNVSSFVRINVSPHPVTPKQQSVQVSTDAIGNEGEQFGITVKQECIDANMETSENTSITPSPKRVQHKNQSGRGRGRGRPKQNTDSTKTKMIPYETPDGKVTYVFNYNGNSHEDRVQVKVLSVTEEGSSKLVHCCTVGGVVPSRTLKLHYPLSHPLPADIKYMYVPRMMVHPELMAAKKITDTSTVDSGPDSDAAGESPAEAKCIWLKEESVESQTENFDLDECSSDAEMENLDQSTKSGERWGVMKTLARYRQQCRQEKTKLLHLLQDNHKQQTEILKQILNVFQDLQSAL